MNTRIYALAFIAALGLSLPAFAQEEAETPQDVVEQGKAAIAEDTQEIKQDKAAIAEDRKERASALKAHDKDAAKQEQSEIKDGKAELRKDKVERRDDRRVLNSDRAELHRGEHDGKKDHAGHRERKAKHRDAVKAQHGKGKH